MRPLPAIRCTRVFAGSAIGASEIVPMTLPVTSTCAGADSFPRVPSKMRTFSKITAAAGAPTWAGASDVARHPASAASTLPFRMVFIRTPQGPRGAA